VIPEHCRHRTYPERGTLDRPPTCLAGIAYADVTIPRDHEGRDLGPVWNREPCSAKGRANGAACPCFAPWTAEEIAEEERQVDALLSAVVKGLCPECGQALVRRGPAFACPTPGHVSGFACNPREGERRSRR
jgi:hypothetical protein